MIRSGVILCGLLLGGSGVALAQSGSLSGRVLSRESRAPLEAARIEILGTTLATTTDAAGAIAITGIPIGVYAARFSYFMSPKMRGWVKPSIEIMGALPTTILGFLAGLWFAPYVKKTCWRCCH